MNINSDATDASDGFIWSIQPANPISKSTVDRKTIPRDVVFFSSRNTKIQQVNELGIFHTSLIQIFHCFMLLTVRQVANITERERQFHWGKRRRDFAKDVFYCKNPKWKLIWHLCWS